uniref:Uncharacterized protein n=1 Tax=Moschus moschiferus TaxID=68415 RepID=A0A8C6ECT9_MOSMO
VRARRQSRPCPTHTQSPERERRWGPRDQLRPRGGHGWETGGQLCGQITLSIACAGVGDTEEARLIQIRITAEKQGWRGEERGRELWSGHTIRPDIPVPPPTTTPVTKSPWWALSHDCGWRCIQAASPLGNYKTELYDPAMEKYQPSPQWINLFVFVKDPKNKNLLARQYGPRGSFTFTSQSPGEHQVCLHLQSIRFALFYDGKLVSMQGNVTNPQCLSPWGEKGSVG